MTRLHRMRRWQATEMGRFIVDHLWNEGGGYVTAVMGYPHTHCPECRCRARCPWLHRRSSGKEGKP